MPASSRRQPLVAPVAPESEPPTPRFTSAIVRSGSSPRARRHPLDAETLGPEHFSRDEMLEALEAAIHQGTPRRHARSGLDDVTRSPVTEPPTLARPVTGVSAKTTRPSDPLVFPRGTAQLITTPRPSAFADTEAVRPSPAGPRPTAAPVTHRTPPRQVETMALPPRPPAMATTITIVKPMPWAHAPAARLSPPPPPPPPMVGGVVWPHPAAHASGSVAVIPCARPAHASGPYPLAAPMLPTPRPSARQASRPRRSAAPFALLLMVLGISFGLGADPRARHDSKSALVAQSKLVLARAVALRAHR